MTNSFADEVEARLVYWGEFEPVKAPSNLVSARGDAAQRALRQGSALTRRGTLSPGPPFAFFFGCSLASNRRLPASTEVPLLHFRGTEVCPAVESPRQLAAGGLEFVHISSIFIVEV